MTRLLLHFLFPFLSQAPKAATVCNMKLVVFSSAQVSILIIRHLLVTPAAATRWLLSMLE